MIQPLGGLNRLPAGFARRVSRGLILTANLHSVAWGPGLNQQEESQASSSIHYSLLPGWSCSGTSHLRLLQPCIYTMMDCIPQLENYITSPSTPLTASCQESVSSRTHITNPVAKQRETVNEAQSLDPQLSSFFILILNSAPPPRQHGTPFLFLTWPVCP